MIQEQLFLGCKNSYSCDARTTVVISPFFIVLDISVVSVSAMLVDTRQKKISLKFLFLSDIFFVSIYPAASHGTCLAVFLAAVLPLC